MRLVPFVVASALLVVPTRADAGEPDTSLAFFTAAALDAAGFVVGGALVAGSPRVGSGDGQRSLGWLAMQGGFTLSPLVAHAVVGEWERGAAFAAVPAAGLAGTAAFYRSRTDGVQYGTWQEQWLVWGLFTAGLGASLAGAVDVLFAEGRASERSIAVRPSLGIGQAGLAIEGRL